MICLKNVILLLKEICLINKGIVIPSVVLVPSYILSVQFCCLFFFLRIGHLSRLSRIVHEMYHVPTIFGIFIIHPHPISLRKKKKCFFMRNQLVTISIKARYQKSVFEMQVGNVIVAINGDGKNNKIQ